MPVVSGAEFLKAARKAVTLSADSTQTTWNGLKQSLKRLKQNKHQYLSKHQWVQLNTWVVTKSVKI